MPRHSLQTVERKQVIAITDGGDLIFGTCRSYDRSQRQVSIERARVRFSARHASMYELCTMAISGPSQGEEMSGQIPMIEIGNIRCLLEVTADAASAWGRHGNE